MRRTAASIALLLLAPGLGVAQELVDAPQPREDAEFRPVPACVPLPRPEAQTSYLSLIVGPDGVADDDAFRVAEGEPCLTLGAAGE